MRALKLPMVLAVLPPLLAAACVDPSSTGPAAEDFPFAAAMSGDCELTGDVARNARSWFPQPEQRDATDAARDIRSACDAGMQSTVTTLSWQVLGMMESLIAADRGGDAAVGSLLANQLLACTTSLCLSSALPGIDLTGSIVGAGLFAIRSGGTSPAIARGLVPFIDEEGNPNSALWGVTVDQPWSVVTGFGTVLIYGKPALTGPALQELNIGDLRYDLNMFPDPAFFVDGALHVGVCFSTPFELPLVAGAEPGAVLQRNSVILEQHQPSFCPTATQSASVLAPLLSVARALAPASLRSLFRVGFVGVIGGTPLDFSTFAPLAANTAATLEFVTEPNPVVVAGQSIGEIRVRARSGSGTLMEKVEVTLSILNNSGEPAGAELAGDLVSYTGELAGAAGIAVFPDDGPAVTVGKAGGYRICADGELAGFTFARVCSNLFQARNAN